MKRILICIGLFLSLVASAQPSEATLVVTGEGTTKEEAINQALRSAIEQAFGVFVSANTDILNDDIVKDEIATLTSGNIKSFVELMSMDLPSGGKSVTLQAVVSIGKLVEYSKSHGSKAEFAGATFGANLKMRQLNTENEEQILDHLLSSIIPHDMFNANISIPVEPVLGETFFYEHGWVTNQNKDGDGLFSGNKHFRKPVFTFDSEEKKEQYHLGIFISYHLSDYGFSVIRNLSSVLSSLTLSPSEKEQYIAGNIPFYVIALNKHHYCLRSPLSALLLYRLSALIISGMFDNFNMVIYGQKNQNKYHLYHPYYFFAGESIRWIDSFSRPISEQGEFFLNTGLFVSDHKLQQIVTQKEYNGGLMDIPEAVEEKDKITKQVLINKYGDFTDFFESPSYFGFTIKWDRLENKRIKQIKSTDIKQFGIQIKKDYDTRRVPFTYFFPLAIVHEDSSRILLVECYCGERSPFQLRYYEKGQYEYEYKDSICFSYTSFIFDCFDWTDNKSDAIEKILFPLSFSENELVDITSIQYEQYDKNDSL